MVDEKKFTNRGTGWLVKAVSGPLDIGGCSFKMSMVEIINWQKNPKLPSYELMLKDPETGKVESFPVWREQNKASKRILYASVTALGAEWWVSVGPKDKSQNPTGGDLWFSVLPKQPKPVEPPQPVPAPPAFGDLPDGDVNQNIPF